MNKALVFQIAQMAVYVAVYNYFYVASLAPFEWSNYWFCFLPSLASSILDYSFYFIARNVLFHCVSHRYIATIAIMLSYVIIALSTCFYFSRVLQDDESVTEALSQASIYTPLFLLPFLAIECIFEKLRFLEYVLPQNNK